MARGTEHIFCVQVKVSKLPCRNTLLQVEVWHSTNRKYSCCREGAWLFSDGHNAHEAEGANVWVLY